MPRRALAIGLFSALFAIGACRGVLGIDDSKPLLASDAGDAAADDAGATGPIDAGPPFCKTMKMPSAFLCDDFDEDAGATAENGWDNKVGSSDLGIAGKATIAADESLFFSYPRSAKFDLQPLTSNSSHASAFLVKLLSTTPVALGIEAKVRIVTESFPPATSSTQGRYVLVYASFLPGGSINIVREQTGTSLWVTNGASPPVSKVYKFDGQDFVVGQWSKILISMLNMPLGGDGGPGTGKIAIEIDGVPAMSTDPFLPAEFQTTGSQEVDIGPLARGPLDELVVNFDDIQLF